MSSWQLVMAEQLSFGGVAVDGCALMSHWTQGVTNSRLLKDLNLAAGSHEEN